MGRGRGFEEAYAGLGIGGQSANGHKGAAGVREAAKRRGQADRLIDYALETGAERFVDQSGAPHVLPDGEGVPLNTGAYN